MEQRWDAILRRLPMGQKIVGAEIGVWRGGLSEILLSRRPRLFLYMIDCWKKPDQNSDYVKTGSLIASRAQAEFDSAKKTAIHRTGFAEGRRKIIHAFSSGAVKEIEDGSLDFVFIDGDHSYLAVKNDIEIWYPKVKLGGWIMGHDYNHPNQGQVKQAVNERFYKIELDAGRTWFYKKEE